MFSFPSLSSTKLMVMTYRRSSSLRCRRHLGYLSYYFYLPLLSTTILTLGRSFSIGSSSTSLLSSSSLSNSIGRSPITGRTVFTVSRGGSGGIPFHPRHTLSMSSSSSSTDQKIEDVVIMKEEEIDDPYIFLEEVESEESLTFARTANEKCLSTLGDPALNPSYSRIIQVLESKDRIAYGSAYGYNPTNLNEKLVYNFWKDADHPKGIWRKTTLDDYLKEGKDPNWKIVLDVDALAEKDGISWVWKGSNLLSRRRDSESQDGKIFTRALLSLSRGGSDASVIKEFDFLIEDFVSENDLPFQVPEGKTRASYKSRDVLLIGTAFTDDIDGSLTDSGYPRTVREWERGTPLSDAKTIFEGEKTDVAVNVRFSFVVMFYLRDVLYVSVCVGWRTAVGWGKTQK